MPHKHLLFRSEAREKVLHGATAIADAVRVTLGPGSRAVLIEKKWGKPLVCNDGVTVAKEFSLKDPEEDLGAQMLRGAAERTGDAVGDGTTTATLLAHAMVAEGTRNIAAGASAIDLKRGLDRGARVAIEALRSQSRAVQSQREKQQVATISAHNDPVIGELVAGAIRVGAPSEAETPGGGGGVLTRCQARRTDMAIPQSIQHFLGNQHVSFSVIHHRPAYTAQEEAATSHVPGRQWAKTVACFADGRPILAVLPAASRIDLERLREVTGAQKVRLANEQEFAGLYPDCETGAMPPLGPLYRQRVYVDRVLAGAREIAFHAGSHTDAIRLSYEDFVRLVQPTVGDFAGRAGH